MLCVSLIGIKKRGERSLCDLNCSGLVGKTVDLFHVSISPCICSILCF